ncbi:MAG: SIS domain-containing protein [Oscillospiraceae bacterium]|jgi:glucosamine--fructose-6-phosphate aminotransferase (isomerizing)|nr:SIS domain-containing protein [Oscillospiraceae bacterium]
MLSEILEQPAVLVAVEAKNKAVLEQLTCVLKKRNVTHAVLAGRGTSDHACVYGQYMLGTYPGIVAAQGIPSCVTLYNGRLDLSGAAVVGVSQSGKAADALALLERGRGQGAVTVAITNDAASPMAGAAEFHLDCSAGPELSVAATKTFTAQLYLFGLLAGYLAEDEGLLTALRELPGRCPDILDAARRAAEARAPEFCGMKDGFVLSRGFCYPVALEAALKIQETCYIKIKGHAVSDFYHGPMAQMEPETPVILFAGRGAAFADSAAMLARLEQIGAKPLVVTDDQDLAGTHNGVLLPGAGMEAAGVFAYAFFAQCFAQALSVSLGLDPDKPRLLNKVTVTR